MDIHEQIAVMQAFADGEEVQIDVGQHEWRDDPDPEWNWVRFNWRIKPQPKIIWVNEYRQGFSWNVHHTEERAIKCASKGIIRTAPYIQLTDEIKEKLGL